MIIDYEKISHAIDVRAIEDVKTNEILGANIYVSHNGKVFHNASYGYKTADKKVKLKEDHIFRLASMTKPIVTVAILQLIEKGKLDLFDRADKFINGFNGFYVGKVEDGKAIPVKKAENPIRILDLLTHSSGLGSGKLWEMYAPQRTDADKKTLDTIIDFYKKTCLSFEPYCGNEYSGQAGFDVLAKIIEIVTGYDIEDYLKKEILIPLEMVDTVFTPTKEQWSRLVDMHDTVNGESVSVDMKGCIFSGLPITYKCGGAGLVSTLPDYVKFAEMLLSGGEYKGRRIVSENSVKSMGIPHLLEQYAWHDTSWGLGVRVLKTDNGYLTKDCYGWSGAYGSHFWVDPINRIVAVYMRNSIRAGGSSAITARHLELDVMGGFRN